MDLAMQKKPKKVLFLSVLILMLVVGTGCAGDLSNIDLQAATNAMPSAGGKQEEPGGLPGLYVKEVTGHKWALIYDAKSETAELKVSIVSWDEERYSLTDVHFNCEYVFDDSSRSGGTVSVSLDSFTDPNGAKSSGGIKGAIEHCYNESGQPGVVGVFEDYPSVQFELIGTWEKRNGNVNGTLVEHESFDYLFNANGSGGQSLFLSLDGRGSVGNRKIQGESESFSVQDETLYAASNFDFWTSLIDPPKANLAYVEHYVWNDTGKVTAYSPKQDVQVNAARIILTPTILEVTSPTGFNLIQFIVDPKDWGSGGI